MNSESQLVSNAELFLKLFEMLKDAQYGTQQNLEKQTVAIATLSSYLKEGVQLEEIKKMVEEHDKESGNVLNDIDSCTEAINKRSESLDTNLSSKIDVATNKIDTVKSRIDKIIIVIGVAFALLAISYFVVRSNIESIIDKQIKISSPAPTYDVEAIDKQILQQLKEIREEMKRLHPNGPPVQLREQK